VIEWNREPIKAIKKAFANAVRDAGLGPDVVPHTLRHTAATWQLQAGTDPYEAAGYLGMTAELRSLLRRKCSRWRSKTRRRSSQCLPRYVDESPRRHERLGLARCRRRSWERSPDAVLAIGNSPRAPGVEPCPMHATP
jgi:integrase-like protein